MKAEQEWEFARLRKIPFDKMTKEEFTRLEELLEIDAKERGVIKDEDSNNRRNI